MGIDAATATTRPPRIRMCLLLLFLGTTATHATMFLARPISSYRVLALGGSETDVGIVAASAALLPIFLAIGMGRLSDRGKAPFLLVMGVRRPSSDRCAWPLRTPSS